MERLSFKLQEARRHGRKAVPGLAALALGVISTALQAAPRASVHAVNAQPQSSQVVFWHNQDGEQARFLSALVAEFNQRQGPKAPRIRAETGLELETALLAQLRNPEHAEAVLLASDLTGMRSLFHLSEIGWSNPEVKPRLLETVRVAGKVYGAPILSGNHVMLYFNKKYVTTPASSWSQIQAQAEGFRKQGIAPILWSLKDPYYMLPVLDAFGGWPVAGERGEKVTLDTQPMRRTLEFYGSLRKEGMIPAECAQGCSIDPMLEGKAAYAIGGEWDFLRAKKALGTSFGVAPLPSILGKRLRTVFSTHAIVFPSSSLSGRSQALLRKFTLYLQSRSVQERWMREMRRMPVIALSSDPDPDFHQSMQIMEAGRPLPNSTVMPFVWRAMKRGITQFVAGATDTAGAARLMQEQAVEMLKKERK